MKKGKFFIFILALYFFAVLQASFFAHFRVIGFVPNLTLFLVIIWNIFEKTENFFSFGLLSAFLGGFFIDIYSSYFFGFYILIFLAVSIIIKKFLKKYVRIPLGERV